uniref:ketohexokinase-like n=1 Tax=Styela clava TaxID=7725 RepID=UPI00193A0DFE|nr:ketohexokinase-like [Styela clava]
MSFVKSSKYILSVGQICADLITICESYPEEDLQVCAQAQYWQRGGNAGNFAEVISHLGNKVEFMGTFPDMSKMKQSIMGGIAEARYCLAELDRARVSYEHLAFRDCQSFPSTSSVLSKTTGTRTIAHYRGPLDELTIEDFAVLDLNKYCWIHFEGRKNGDVMEKEIEIIQQHNSTKKLEDRVSVSVELELPEHASLAKLIPLADMIIISRYFARHLGFQSAIECVAKLRHQLKKGGDIVCSWGHLGAAHARNVPDNIEQLVQAVKPERVLDTLGAGDTFQASLVHARLNGLDLNSTVLFACEVASKKVASIGYNSVIGLGIN